MTEHMGMEFEAAVIGAAIGALTAYLLSLRITKRQRMHQCYTSIYPIIEYTILILEQIRKLQELDIDKEDSKESYYFEIFSGRGLVSDLGVYYDSLREFEESEFDKWKEEKEEIEYQRELTFKLLIWELSQNLLRMKTQIVTIELGNPSQKVKVYLEKTNTLIGHEILKMISWAYTKSKELQVDTVPLRVSLVDLGNTIKTDLKKKW